MSTATSSSEGKKPTKDSPEQVPGQYLRPVPCPASDGLEPARQGYLLAETTRIMRFGFVGALGTVANLLIMGFLLRIEVHYLLAAAVAAELTIIGNFLLQERLVFTTNAPGTLPTWRRFWMSFGFNNGETLLRMPFLWILVELGGLHSLVAQGGTLLAAFLLRYTFHSRVVYRSPKTIRQVLEPVKDVPQA